MFGFLNHKYINALSPPPRQCNFGTDFESNKYVSVGHILIVLFIDKYLINDVVTTETVLCLYMQMTDRQFERKLTTTYP